MVLCWACWFTNSSNAQELIPGQIYTTPDITNNSAWVGAVYQQSLTCWAWGDPGYCGPQPIVRPGGEINFSYGSSYIYQQPLAQQILPPLAGLQVNGYNFSFMAKNGNGWDDGRTDQLTALVRLWDTTGGRSTSNLLYGNAYNLNYKFNWTNFNYSENFTTPLAASSIGTVQYGFIGRDNNGWAGPYGPEIYGVNFSLKYSVDPCIANPMYSTSCPGYLAALAKLMPAPTTEAVVAPVIETQTVVAAPVAETTQPVQQQAVQANITPTTAATSSAQSTTPTAAAASPVAQEKSSGGSAPIGFALSLIAKNSDREKAIAQAVVANADAQAQAAGDRAQQTAQQTASAAIAQSVSSSENSFSGTGIQATSSSSRSNLVNFNQPQQSGQGILLAAQSISSSNQQNSAIQLLTPVSFENLQSTQPVAIFNTQERQQQESETIAQTTSFLTDLNSPLKQILDAQQLQQASVDQPQQSQRRDTTPNQLAVGVSITQLATQPQGYASYLNIALRDAQFYEPKEVYRNQTVIDNVRVLRGLGSDQRHQDLVNSQYK